MKRIKIILLDRHEIFLAGLRSKFTELASEFEIIGETSDQNELFNLLTKHKIPDVLVIDYNLPGGNGFDVIRKLRQDQDFKKIKIIVLTDYTSPILSYHNYEFIREAIDIGANGYLLKDSKFDDLANAIRKVVADDEFVLGKTVNLQEISQEMIKDRRSLLARLKKQNNFNLTQREIEVIRLLAQGYSSKQIGFRLQISEDAVTNHKDNIKSKLKEKYNINLKNVVEMIVWAIKNKIIQV